MDRASVAPVRAVTIGRTVLLSGGSGGAWLAPVLAQVLGPGNPTEVVNDGDDLDWHGLRVCPDLDTVLYALGGHLDTGRGWGRSGDTFVATAALAALGEASWFGVGDRDLATHLVRSEHLASGRSLTEATEALGRQLGAGAVTVVPASDQLCPTRLELEDGRWVGFQEWYVGERAEPAVRTVAPGQGPAASAALEALAAASAVVLGPSNPLTSIGTILALDGMAEAVGRVPLRFAVSPVAATAPPPGAVAHHALARRQLLGASGDVDSPAGIAGHYARRYPGLVDSFVLDIQDAAQAPDVECLGMRPVLTRLLDPLQVATTLAGLFAAGPGAVPVHHGQGGIPMVAAWLPRREKGGARSAPSGPAR